MPRKPKPLPTAAEALRGRQVPLCSLGGSTPHESWGNWAAFLRTCEVRDVYRKVVFFGLTNCNYILFPTGELLCNFGYHGKNVMHDVRHGGWRPVLRAAKQYLESIRVEPTGAEHVKRCGEYPP